MFTKDIGIDLGTANTLVYMKGRGIIMREPSVVAVDPRSDELRVRSVGHEAKAVIGRAPGSIVAVRPLKDGVIADFDVTAAMLQSFIRQACGNSILARPRVVICVPSGVTEVERRAVREATLKAGARQVSVIEEPMAAAIGAGLPISEPTGSMIVDIGGGTAEIAVISLGGIVASRSVRMAGDMFDQAIIAFIKRKYNLLIGERTAEQIKIEIGSAYPMDPEMTMEIKGRNLVDGLPKNIVVHSEDVREALLECLVKITSAIKETLERTPPELSADIIDHGITLTGGGALLRGLDQLIQSETGIDVHIAEDPLDCLSYYSSLEHSEYYIVNAGGDIDEDEHDSKIACTELTVIKRLTKEELFLHGLAYMVDHPRRVWSSHVAANRAMANCGYAVVRGKDPVATGRLGDILAFAKEAPDSEAIVQVAVGRVDGITLMPDVWYGVDLTRRTVN